MRADKSGWEPRRLFTMVEFMMHDKDCSGTIDSDECLEILYRRLGNDQIDSKVNEFMKQADLDGEIGTACRDCQPASGPRALPSPHFHALLEQQLCRAEAPPGMLDPAEAAISTHSRHSSSAVRNACFWRFPPELHASRLLADPPSECLLAQPLGALSLNAAFGPGPDAQVSTACRLRSTSRLRSAARTSS